MRAIGGRTRWALSFADLSLLLLGFFVLLQARPDRERVGASLRAAFSTTSTMRREMRAEALFEPGEAVLRPAAERDIAAFAHHLGRRHATIASRGTEPGSPRFDGWELAAARSAAIGRAMVRAGISAARVAIDIAPITGGGQTFTLSAA